MTPVRVRGLHGVARGAEAVLVVETLTGGCVLAFRIPPGEAARVARVLGLAGCRRVPIYDLVGGLAESLGARVSGAVQDARPSGIAARVRVSRHGTGSGEVEIPCHPADAIALALQAAAPIYATGEALHQTTQSTQSTPIHPAPERPSLAAWLERVRPEDFVTPSHRGEPGDT
jgi:bifunctional DNase/RNase